MATASAGEVSVNPRYSCLHMQDIDEVLTKLTQQNCHPEAGKRSVNMYKQGAMHALINNRIVDYDKLSPETSLVPDSFGNSPRQYCAYTSSSH